MRIVEPLIKAHLALWLIRVYHSKEIVLRVDGAEPGKELLLGVLRNAGFERTPLPRSEATYTGSFIDAAGVSVTVRANPGIDVEAVLGDRTRFIAECKGEPMKGGIKAGFERTNMHTCIGQVLVAAGNGVPQPAQIAVALPDLRRTREAVSEAIQSELIRKAGIRFLLVNDGGNVREVAQQS